MASGAYSHLATLLSDAGINLSTATIKIALVGTHNGGYVFNKANTHVDNGTSDANSILYNELNATNYVGGYGGAGRKALTIAFTEDLSGGHSKGICTNITWTSLGSATNDTVNGAVALLEQGSTDAGPSGSIPLWYWQLPATPTNGSDFTLNMDPTNGNFVLAV